MTAQENKKVYTIGAGAPFAATLAKGLIARAGGDPLALSRAIIYLPTRRAARGFGDAFAEVMGGAALLPQFRALGDADEDELLFQDGALELAPAIAPLRRQLLLAHLVRRWHQRQRGHELGFAQAAALAEKLTAVMDEIETQGSELSGLAELAPAELAEHWQEVQGFLGLLRDAWPGVLEAEGARNPAERRNAAIRLLTAQLETSSPQGMVIAAGSTGSIPATAEFLGAIARLPNGAVVLPGLDRTLDETGWASLDPGHPQYGLKQLLARIGIARDAVKDWDSGDGHGRGSAREHLLSEALRPAPTTDAWWALVKKGGGDLRRGLEGLSLVEANDPAEEALVIALALRQALETKGRSAALVTPDRGLARRVAAELKRWEIAIDDSAGRPLAHAAAGAFLCLVAEAAEARFAPVPLLALLKHPFARRGHEAAAFRAHARALDLAVRGPRPDPGLAGISHALEKANAELREWWDGIAALLRPLEQLFAQGAALPAELIAAHLAAAEALACDHETQCLLWTNADGEAAADFAASLQDAAAHLPAIEPSSYPPLFRRLAMGRPVRAAHGQHPRLAILGPLEARLQRFDLTILGGLNEGAWPQAASADPWFSRPMRDALKLERPERRIGLAAHDFAMLAAGPQVLLTRALKAEGAPTVPSRWLQRLIQLTRGLDHADGALAKALQPADLLHWARAISAVARANPAPRPSPRPPVEWRPRRLSVTEIETWLRDPYAIYAKHVLRLRKLDPLDEEVGPLERGTILHGAVEEFVRRHPALLPDDAARLLTSIAAELFDQAGTPRAARAIWLPRFADAARGFIASERARRTGLAAPHVELKGQLDFPAPGGKFTLSGRADRIDLLQDGTAAILDYKSGATMPSAKQVTELLAPQLPLEAAMLAEDGFGIGRFLAEQLIYVSLADGRKAADPTIIAGGAALGALALARLKQRVARFDERDTPYYPRVMPFRAASSGDYDHLARVREWSATAEDA